MNGGDFSWQGVTIFALFVVLMVSFGVLLDREAQRQSTVAVACEPNVDGLRKNGKEIPLTSAQRDSLARVP